jgi:hypothetical protein
MRYVFLVVLMTAVMLGLITWATRPDVLVAQYNSITAPITKHFAEKHAAAWQTAKEQAWKKWMAQTHMPGDCSKPATSLRTLECQNLLQLQANTFEREWSGKVANGWQPEGVN